MNILEVLADKARQRVREAKEKQSLPEIREKALSLPQEDFPFEEALKKPGLSFICECKKASPSRGIIAEEFPYTDIAKAYEYAGADAVSVLTEPYYFLGKDDYLAQIAETVSIPCLRKDFIVDEYMVYEAKILGAKAFLLIVSLLDEEQLKAYIRIGDELGLSALVETRSPEEIKLALKAGSRIIGVNNRNLKDFTVDTAMSGKLREIVPQNVLFVAESGIKTREDIRAMENIGADAVLVGETMMLAKDKKAKLLELRGKT